MAGSFEDDPGIDTSLDYEEMREGIAPPRFTAGVESMVDQFNQRMAGREMHVEVVVKDAQGEAIVIQPFPHVVRWGESISLDITLALEVS